MNIFIIIVVTVVLFTSSVAATSLALGNDEDEQPLCDGSLQDCVSSISSGVVCLAGSKKAECECAY